VPMTTGSCCCLQLAPPSWHCCLVILVLPRYCQLPMPSQHCYSGTVAPVSPVAPLSLAAPQSPVAPLSMAAPLSPVAPHLGAATLVRCPKSSQGGFIYANLLWDVEKLLVMDMEGKWGLHIIREKCNQLYA